MTSYRYFLLSSVLQFPYSFNLQQYRFFFASPSPRLCPHLAPLHRKSCRRPWRQREMNRVQYQQQVAIINTSDELDTQSSKQTFTREFHLQVLVTCWTRVGEQRSRRVHVAAGSPCAHKSSQTILCTLPYLVIRGKQTNPSSHSLRTSKYRK